MRWNIEPALQARLLGGLGYLGVSLGLASNLCCRRILLRGWAWCRYAALSHGIMNGCGNITYYALSVRH